MLGSFEVLSDHGDTEEDGEESSFFDCWDEQSDVLQLVDPLGTECTEVLYPLQKDAFL